MTLLKTFTEVIGNPRLRDRDNYKESAAFCPITKATNNSHFNSYLSFFIFPASIVQYNNIFSSLLFKIKKVYNVELRALYHKQSTASLPLNKVKPWETEDQYEYEYPVL